MNNKFNYIPNIKRLINNKKVNVIKMRNDYLIVNYNRENLEENYLDEYGLLKSALFNNQGLLVSLFPQKRVDTDYFINININSPYQGRELIEGYSFSLFWDDLISVCGAWEIHELNNIGSNMLVNESVIKKKLNEYNENKCNLIDYLNKKYIYHFCFSHNNDLYLLDIFSIKLESLSIIKPTMNYNIKVECNKIEFFTKPLKENFILLPREFSKIETIQKIRNYSLFLTENKNEKGIELIGETGLRCKIYNNSYKYVKILKSIYPKNIYMYLNLKKINKFIWNTEKNKFNKYVFIELSKYYSIFLKTILYKYNKIFIKKIYSIDEENLIFKTILTKLHNLYITELRQKKTYCQFKHVFEILNNFKIEEQMYFITYLLRDD